VALQAALKKLVIIRPHLPSSAERTIFEMCAREVRRVGSALATSPAPRLSPTAPLDLSGADEVQFVLTSIRAAARQHIDSGQDMLALVDRVDAMLGSAGKPDARGRLEACLYVVRAIAMAELLVSESRAQFPRYAPLRMLAEEVMSVLVRGFVERFGGELPAPIHRVFPHFADAAREVWRPVRRSRGLLPRLLKPRA